MEGAFEENDEGTDLSKALTRRITSMSKKKAWGALVSLNADCSMLKPVKLIFDDEDGEYGVWGWWTCDNGLPEMNALQELGTDRTDEDVVFSSKSKKEVKMWIKGVKDAMYLMGLVVERNGGNK